MPLPQSYAKGVLFVGRKSPGGRKRITATGFLVTMEMPNRWHSYVVTAAHVVEGSDEIFVRIRMKDGSFKDESALDWVPNGRHDVAVAAIDLDDYPGHDLIATCTEQFVDREGGFGEYGEIELGDAVYFIGLLGKVKAMTERNVPLVRTAFLGALKQENVPVKRPGEQRKLITAHLIDCRSFSGFSGSPCYIQKHMARVVRRDDGSPGVTTEYRTLLLGLIGGHFDDWAKTQSREFLRDDAEEDDESDDAYQVNDDVRAPVSTGVGYVIPVEFVRETLMNNKDLINLRAEDEMKAAEDAAGEDEDNAATEDSIQDERSEFERFEDLARYLVNTPKPAKDDGAGTT